MKQRAPRLLPWLDERRPDVVCLQETKLGREAFTMLLGGELDEAPDGDIGPSVPPPTAGTSRGAAVRARGTGSPPGAAGG